LIKGGGGKPNVVMGEKGGGWGGGWGGIKGGTECSYGGERRGLGWGLEVN